MKRRTFMGCGVGVTVAAAASAPATAQSLLIEGRTFVRLSPPAPVSAPPGKIEVVDFFWYGCPHCFAFEPALDSWVRRLPNDVAFRRVPVGFTARHQVHQKVFYALEMLGKLDAMHARFFNAIHAERRPLDSPGDIAAYMASQGIDQKAFVEAFKSFTVESKARQASALSDAYRIDGVPALGIHGRFYTSPGLAGGDGTPAPQAHALALAVTDRLVDEVRKHP